LNGENESVQVACSELISAQIESPERKEIILQAETTDQPILKSIQRLAAEEHRLFAQEMRTDADHARLSEIKIELDQCWELLRQCQAQRDAKQSPNQARDAAAGDRRKLRRMI
jgi:uncharacterized protein DUF2630